MTAFAFEGGVSSEAVQGSVEITDEQYEAAIAAMLSGRIVTVDGGFALVDPPAPPAPEPEPDPEYPDLTNRVTARQFKLQLLAAGLLDQVEAWIELQDRAVQIAYNNSGTFVRTEPMMQAGFTALGFTPEQIDSFFTAAAEI